MHMDRPSSPKSLLQVVWVLFVLLWGCVGCSSLSTMTTDSNPKELRLAIDQFHNAVRWEAYDAAMIFVSPPLMDDFSRLSDMLRDKVRITDFEVRQPRFDAKTKSGWVTVHFKLYRQNNPQLETIAVREKWTFPDKGDRWQIVQHDFKDLMR